MNLHNVVNAFAKIPGARHLIGYSKSNPLHLFDIDKAAKISSSDPYFFAGKTIQVGAGGAHTLSAADPRLARNRKIGAGVIGGLGAMNLLGVDPMGATTGGNTALGGAFHASVGGTMFNLGGKTRMAGIGYLGLGVVNAMRAGNQVGPY